MIHSGLLVASLHYRLLEARLHHLLIHLRLLVAELLVARLHHVKLQGHHLRLSTHKGTSHVGTGVICYSIAFRHRIAHLSLDHLHLEHLYLGILGLHLRCGLPLVVILFALLAAMSLFVFFILGQLFLTLELFLLLFLHFFVIRLSHLQNEHIKLYLGVLGL